MKRIIPIIAVAAGLSLMLMCCRSRKQVASEYSATVDAVTVAVDSADRKTVSVSDAAVGVETVEIEFTPPDTAGVVYVSRIRKSESHSDSRIVETAGVTEKKTAVSGMRNEKTYLRKGSSEREPPVKPAFWLTAFAVCLTIILILNKKS